MTYFEPLSAEQLGDFYKEWNMTPESLKKDAQYIMEWLEQQPHLPNFKDEKFIIGLIQKCKNRLESTKEVLEITFTLRATIYKLMDGPDIAEVEYEIFFGTGLFQVPLPKLTPEGHRVWVFKPSKNASKHSPNVGEAMRVATASVSVLVPHEQSTGAISIIDLEGLTAVHIAFYSANMRMLGNITKILPRRIIRTYVLNLSPMTNAVFTLAKSLLKEKLGERIIPWTGKPEDLANEISKDVLPTEFGGNSESLEKMREKYREYMMSHRDLMKEASETRADLTKKPRDSKIYNELFDYGVDGSFRTLSIE